MYSVMAEEGYCEVDSTTTGTTDVKVLRKGVMTLNIISHDNNALYPILHGPTAIAFTFISADSVMCVYPALLLQDIDLANMNWDTRIPNDFVVSPEKLTPSRCAELQLRCEKSALCTDKMRNGGDGMTLNWRFDNDVYDDTEYSRKREKRRIGMEVVWRLGRR